jgi:inhibitor of cysteine peptidase
MRRRVAIVAAAALLVALAAPSAQAELCAKCKGMVFTTDLGTCKACGGDTSSRAFALCAACSRKLGECEHCRAQLASAAKPAAPADPKAEPAEPAGDEVKGYPPLGLTQESAGKTLAVVAGRRIEIRLASNITTGYSWTVAELTPGPVKQIGKAEYVPHPRAAGMVGVGGTNVFTFVGTAVGKANLRLEYRRPWEKDTPAAKTFAIGLDVKPDPTPERARQLKAGVETFWLELRYWGDQDKPFYSAILQVGELQGEYPPFVEAARVT